MYLKKEAERRRSETGVINAMHWAIKRVFFHEDYKNGGKKAINELIDWIRENRNEFRTECQKLGFWRLGRSLNDPEKCNYCDEKRMDKQRGCRELENGLPCCHDHLFQFLLESGRILKKLD